MITGFSSLNLQQNIRTINCLICNFYSTVAIRDYGAWFSHRNFYISTMNWTRTRVIYRLLRNPRNISAPLVFVSQSIIIFIVIILPFNIEYDFDLKLYLNIDREINSKRLNNATPVAFHIDFGWNFIESQEKKLNFHQRPIAFRYSCRHLSVIWQRIWPKRLLFYLFFPPV